jgi:hypothetical protein
MAMNSSLLRSVDNLRGPAGRLEALLNLAGRMRPTLPWYATLTRSSAEPCTTRWYITP